MGIREGIVRRDNEKITNDDRKWIRRDANIIKYLIKKYSL